MDGTNHDRLDPTMASHSGRLSKLKIRKRTKSKSESDSTQFAAKEEKKDIVVPSNLQPQVKKKKKRTCDEGTKIPPNHPKDLNHFLDITDPLVIVGIYSNQMDHWNQQLTTQKKRNDQQLFRGTVPNHHPHHDDRITKAKEPCYSISHPILGTIALNLTNQQRNNNNNNNNNNDNKTELAGHRIAPWNLHHLTFPRPPNHIHIHIHSRHRRRRYGRMGDGTVISISSVCSFPSQAREKQRMDAAIRFQADDAKGSIAIVASQGATIRSSFDIDESEELPPLGHLQRGAIRNYRTSQKDCLTKKSQFRNFDAPYNIKVRI